MFLPPPPSAFLALLVLGIKKKKEYRSPLAKLSEANDSLMTHVANAKVSFFENSIYLSSFLSFLPSLFFLSFLLSFFLSVFLSFFFLSFILSFLPSFFPSFLPSFLLSFFLSVCLSFFLHLSIDRSIYVPYLISSHLFYLIYLSVYLSGQYDA